MSRIVLPIPHHCRVLGYAKIHERPQMFCYTICKTDTNVSMSKFDKLALFKDDYADQIIRFDYQSISLNHIDSSIMSRNDNMEIGDVLEEYIYTGNRGQTFNVLNNLTDQEVVGSASNIDISAFLLNDSPGIINENEILNTTSTMNLNENIDEIPCNPSSSEYQLQISPANFDLHSPIYLYQNIFEKDDTLKKYRDVILKLEFSVQDIVENSENELIQAILEITTLSKLTAKAICIKLMRIFKSS